MESQDRTMADESHFTRDRSFVSDHTCSVTERSALCREATPEILRSLYTDFIGGVEPTILLSHVRESLNMCFGIKVSFFYLCTRKLCISLTVFTIVNDRLTTGKLTGHRNVQEN